ncbi:uncharacterized protein N7511_004370 [Penicillium nucicola]|uniref:uncharacterized protein n=1 Tax=Penicillium nucicola TaxID=1850975 RepID=UPI002545291F|nr:uncharacterized protein N7511_004370 [Penicillium nucicola]KAJ5766754.1 hypothetical protein N7511_004370 [Penicillium nucicola]
MPHDLDRQIILGHQSGTNDTVIKRRFGRRAIVQWGQLTMLLWPTGEGLIQMGVGSSLPQLGRTRLRGEAKT